MAKPIKATLKLPNSRRRGQSGAPGRPGFGPARHQYPAVLPAVQRSVKEMAGNIIPAEITIYEDRTFEFKLKTPPASDLLRKAAGVEKGSAVPHKNKVGFVTKEDLRMIAEKKMVDLNAGDIEAAMNIVAGTARSMGIEVKD